MSKTIKISQKQYRMLMESDDESFSYVGDSDINPYDNFAEISTDGINPDIDYNNPTTGDMTASMRTMDGWNRYRSYGNNHAAVMREGVDITNKEDNTADDFGEVDASDDNRLENPNLVQIPNTVKQREKLLIDNTKNLTDMQKAVVLNDLLPYLTSDNTTFHQQKRTDKAILKSNSNIPNITKKNLANKA